MTVRELITKLLHADDLNKDVVLISGGVITYIDSVLQANCNVGLLQKAIKATDSDACIDVTMILGGTCDSK